MAPSMLPTYDVGTEIDGDAVPQSPAVLKCKLPGGDKP